MRKTRYDLGLRAKTITPLANTVRGEELMESGPLAYRYLHDWMDRPAQLEDFNILRVACGDRGLLYALTDSPRDPVAVFGPDGKLIELLGEGCGFVRPYGICADQAGNVWVADKAGHFCRRLSRGGTADLTLGTPYCPSDTGVNDTTEDTRLRYRTVQRMGGPFNRPAAIAQGPDDCIYVADGLGNAALHKFSADGVLLKSWGGPGEKPGRFSIPYALCVDGAGRVWVADREYDRVQVFDSEGELLRVIENLLYPASLAWDGKYVYIGESEGRISAYDSSYNLVAQLGFYASRYCPEGLAADKEGNLYLALPDEYHQLIKLERLKGEMR